MSTLGSPSAVSSQHEDSIAGERAYRHRAQHAADYQIAIGSLRAEVAATGLQRVEIAERLGKPKAYVSKVLNGSQAATLTELRAICIAAGIPFVEWVKKVDAVLAELLP